MGNSLRLACASIALAVTACSSPAATEDVGQSNAALSPSPNDQAAFDFFIGKGLTAFQAAGIVGNLDQESQVDPTAVQAGGPGRGIAQWSVGGRWDTDANDNVLSYATKQGESSSSLKLQLEFIWYELQTFSAYGLAKLQATTNVTDATIAFETDFEGCGTCDQATRIADAQAALAAYGTFNYGASFVGQSFPLASTALTMKAGDTLSAYIELKNTGTKSWDTSTRLATSNPRDRASAFADSTWVATNRPARVSGAVAPGATYKFSFVLHAPNKNGTYLEYFNLVEEGGAWFSDPGQGGPGDDVLEANIVVIDATDAGSAPPATDGGAAGSAGQDSGSATPTADAGGGATGPTPGAAGGDAGGSNGAGAGSATWSTSTAGGGCAITSGRTSEESLAWLFGAAACVVGIRRRVRRRAER